MRGFDLRQVPIYINGFPVHAPYDGHIDLGRFLTTDRMVVLVEGLPDAGRTWRAGLRWEF